MCLHVIVVHVGSINNSTNATALPSMLTVLIALAQLLENACLLA